ncbi:unnamed protein product [Closterium sp. NIES-54]
MALRPSSVQQRVPLPSPPASFLPDSPGRASDLPHAASPTVTRLFTTVVTNPDFESTAAFPLVTELVDFAARRSLDYVASLVTESKSVCPPSLGGDPALGSDVLEDRQFELECLAAALPCFASMLLCPERDPDAPDIPPPRSYVEAIAGEYSSQWQTAMDTEMASWKSTGIYIDEVPPRGANIVDGMWIFRVKRPPGSPPAFKARYVAQGFNHLWRPVYGLRQAPREWHDTLRTTLAALGFAPSSADPSLFLRTDTTLLPFYILVYVDDLVFDTAHTEALALVLQRFGFQFSSPQPTPLSTGHSLSAPPSDESVEPSVRRAWGSCLEDGVHWYTFSLGSGSVSWRSTRSSSVLGSNCEAEIYVGAMVAQELRWLTYLLTDLEEQPRSPPVLYVDNKAMLALCHEQIVEHRTKHIALCYFLA